MSFLFSREVGKQIDPQEIYDEYDEWYKKRSTTSLKPLFQVLDMFFKLRCSIGAYIDKRGSIRYSLYKTGSLVPSIRHVRVYVTSTLQTRLFTTFFTCIDCFHCIDTLIASVNGLFGCLQAIRTRLCLTFNRLFVKTTRYPVTEQRDEKSILVASVMADSLQIIEQKSIAIASGKTIHGVTENLDETESSQHSFAIVVGLDNLLQSNLNKANKVQNKEREVSFIASPLWRCYRMSSNPDYMMVLIITVGTSFSAGLGSELGKYAVELLKQRVKQRKENK